MRKFGVELEFHNPSFDNFEWDIQVIVEKAGHSFSRQETPRSWTLKGEHVGYELTSPALNSTPQNFDKVYNIVESLRLLVAGRNIVRRDCGFHVHFEISDLNDEQLFNIVELFYSLEDNLMDLQPSSRKSNNFCMRLNSRRSKYEKEGFIRNLRTQRGYLCDHYSAVNFGKLSSYGTMEVRYGAGTIRGEKVVNWVQILQFIIESGAAGYTEITRSKKDRLKNFIMSSPIDYWLSARKERLTAWIDQRLEELNSSLEIQEERRKKRAEFASLENRRELRNERLERTRRILGIST